MFAINKRNLLRSLSVAVAATVGAVYSMHARAQDASKDYPSRPIVMVVPYAAGGSSDTRARQVGHRDG